MADDIHELSRQVKALRSEVSAVRKLVERVVVAQQQAKPEGVRTLDDGRVFAPGTGTLGSSELSADAQAALEQLDQERPT